MNGFLALKISDPVMYTLAFVLFIVILIILVLLRKETWKDKGFQNADIILALIPVVFALLISGKIQKFAFAGLEFETVFKEASEGGIGEQITSFESLAPEIIDVEMAAKAGVEKIPELIEKKTEALVFRLGHGGYWGPAIGEYLDQMLDFKFLKLIILEDPDGKLVGVFNAREMAGVVQAPGSPYNLRLFARWINEVNIGAIKQMPGFKSLEVALKVDDNKRVALERLDSLNVNQLPVVDKESRFIGIVDRSRLTASLIIEVAKQIE